MEYVAFIGLFALAIFLMASIFFRRLMIRRTYENGIVWQVYAPSDFCPNRLKELDEPGWGEGFQLDNAELRREAWFVEFKSEGLRRLFYLYKYWEVVEEARVRRQENRGMPYLSIHYICLSALFAVTALKGLLMPSANDIRMLFGFDSFAAARLARLPERDRISESAKRSTSTL